MHFSNFSHARTSCATHVFPHAKFSFYYDYILAFCNSKIIKICAVRVTFFDGIKLFFVSFKNGCVCVLMIKICFNRIFWFDGRNTHTHTMALGIVIMEQFSNFHNIPLFDSNFKFHSPMNDFLFNHACNPLLCEENCIFVQLKLLSNWMEILLCNFLHFTHTRGSFNLNWNNVCSIMIFLCL